MLTQSEQKFLQIIREHCHKIKKLLNCKTHSDAASTAQSSQDDFQAMFYSSELIIFSFMNYLLTNINNPITATDKYTISST